MKPGNTVLYCALALAIAVVVILQFMPPSHPTVSTIHVLNLEKDIGRWKAIEANGKRLGLPLQRFPGFDGRVLTRDTVHPLGVGRAMIRPNRFDEKGEHLVNRGVIGCFIAHRALLTHLASLPYSDSVGHMILEDDIILPDDFLQPGGRWEQAASKIPGTYDIILCGLWHVYGRKIADNIYKLETDPTKRTNLGAFCYVVRHGALRTKILPWLQYMMDAYDDQLALKYGEWESYGIKPNIVELNKEVSASSINAINGGSV